MRMHNPPHPGEILKALCLEPLGLSVTEAAGALGVSRKTLSAILNGRAGLGQRARRIDSTIWFSHTWRAVRRPAGQPARMRS